MAKRRRDSEPTKKRKRAAIYCRVSTFDQNRGEFSSLEDQEQRLRRAAEADGYSVFRIYKEVASSTNLERDELKRLLNNLEEIDALYVTKLDRLSRSMRDWCQLNEVLDEQSVALVSVTQKIDTSTPMGRFFRDLLMLFAQFEREMIAERTFEKMAEQARLGKWSGGRPIMGYDVEGKTLKKNDEEAEIVVSVFDKYLQLGSISKTAQWLNLRGIRTKHVKCKNGREFKPRVFTRADVHRMLTSLTYVGKIQFGGVEYNGAHEGIIEEKRFLEVQQLLSARKEKPRRGDQKQEDTLLLGITRCGFCGGALTSSFVNKRMKGGGSRRYYYYKCTTKSRREAEACPSADLRASLVDDYVVSYVKRLAKDKKLLKAVVKEAEKSSQEGIGGLETERTRLSQRLATTERESMALVDRLADPELAGIGAIKRRLSQLEGEQQQLSAQLTDINLQIRERREQCLSVDEIHRAFADFDEIWDELDFEERQYAIRLVIKEIQLKLTKGEKEGEISIYAWGRRPKPLRIELENARQKKLRNQNGRYPGQDSNLRPAD